MLQIKDLKSKYTEFFSVVSIIGAGWLFIFWQIITQKKFISPWFIGIYHYIYFSSIKYSLEVFKAPLTWWPAYNSGYPIHLTLDGFLNPFFILAAKYMPPLLANNLALFIFFTINGACFYSFARAIKLSKVSSIIATIPYSFSGVTMLYSGVTGIMAVMPFLPLSFLCCKKILDGKRKWFWPWLLILAYSWIGGWSETMVYAVAAVTFFALYITIQNKHKGSLIYKNLIIFFGGIIGSLIILLPWFLSVLYFVSFSERAGGVTLNSLSMPIRLSRFIHMLYPRINILNGDLLPFIPLEANDVFLYIGLLPLILIFVSLFIRNKKSNGHFAFFLALAFTLIAATISGSPIIKIIHALPVLRWFGGYWKWSFVIVFSFSIIAGYGMEGINDFFTSKYGKHFLILLYSLLLAAILVASAVTLFEKKFTDAITSYGTRHYREAKDRVFSRSDEYYKNTASAMATSIAYNFSFRNKWTLITLVLWIITVLYLSIAKYHLIPYRHWRLLGILVTFVGTVVLWKGFLDGPPLSFLNEMPETARYLHSINKYNSKSLPINEKNYQTLEPYRIFLYLPNQYVAILSEKFKVSLTDMNNRLWFYREMMDDNLHVMFDFDTFNNHQALALRRMVDMYYLTKRQEPFTISSYADITPFGEYIARFATDQNAHLLGALNIKYMITPFEIPEPWKKVFTSYVPDNKIPIYIYENPYFIGRWYFAENVKWADSKNELAMEELKKITNFKNTTLIEKLNENDPAISYKSDKNDSIKVALYAPGKLKLKTSAKNYRFLVFSESRTPFWQASINGKEVPLYTANYLYQAVLVPPGDNEVEFRFPNFWEQSVLSAQYFINGYLKRVIKGVL